MTDRRSTDTTSHVHKRINDRVERLHQRMEDNDKLMVELVAARAESFKMHAETTESIKALTLTVANLVRIAERQEGLPEFTEDVRGMMRFMGRLNSACGVMWRPVLFVTVLGGMLWLWITGGRTHP